MNRLRYSASARLGIWDYLRGDSEDFISNLSQILISNSHAFLESEEIDFIRTDDQPLASLMSIIDKILIRGNPTLIDHVFERYLLTSSNTSSMNFTEKGISLSILEPENYPTLPYLSDRVLSALNELYILPYKDVYPISFDSGLSSNESLLESISQEEEIFFTQFKEVFPKQLHHHLHRQVPIRDLGEKQDPSISSGLVDFAFRLGASKIIFEIDGVQHNDPGQQSLDRKRDSLNSNNGWSTHRILASDVRAGVTGFLSSILTQIKRDNSFLDNLLLQSSGISLRLKSRIHDFAYHTLLLPNAIHRALRGLVLLFYYDVINPSYSKKILVIEEDLPVLSFAFDSLYRIWSNLHTLSPETSCPPKLTIDFIGVSSLVPSTSPDLVFRSVDTPDSNYDLIISSSHLLSTGQTGSKESNIFPSRPPNLVAFRKAIGSRLEQTLQGCGPLHYDLSDVEDAIIQQNSGLESEISETKQSSLLFFLHLLFRKKNFKHGQLQVITRLLQGKDTIVLLPTGGGKSLTYQFSGLLLPGMTLVIDPLISLMSDQVENLNNSGFTMVDAITSLQSQKEKDRVLEKMSAGCLSFIFLSPERLQGEAFRNQLLAVSRNIPISLAVIDEAHCVSEWGHDFRPSYLHLPTNITRYCSDDHQNKVTLVGLTGTASFAVLTDIQIEMKITDENAIILPTSFDRKELIFEVIKTRSKAKSSQLKAIKDKIPIRLRQNHQSFYELKGRKTNCGLIFCPHTNGSLGVTDVASLMRHQNYYSGNTPRNFPGNGETYSQYKQRVQALFKKNKIQEIVATKSFGMGFDKPNIRYTIHYAAPNSVEAFYQEAGRAGRNGEPGYAYCSILYSDDNWESAKDLVNLQDTKSGLSKLDRISWDDRGDVLHQLWLLFSSYPGSTSEIKDAKSLLTNKLLPFISDMPDNSTNTVEIPFTEGTKVIQEKALSRLLILGIVQDYSVDYSPNKFKITLQKLKIESVRINLKNYLNQYKFSAYVDRIISKVTGSTLQDTLNSAIDQLITFIYDEIVSKRVQAILTMGELCRSFTTDDDFREKILSYLQESEFSDELRAWIKRDFDEIGLDSIESILSRISTLEELKRLIGTTRRMLDEDPNNIALRYLSVCARARSASEKDESVLQEASFFASRLESRRSFLKDPNSVTYGLFLQIYAHRPSILERFGEIIFQYAGDKSLAVRILSSQDLSKSDMLRKFSSVFILSSIVNQIINNPFLKNLSSEVNND